LQIDDIERAAALHWQAPDTERLGEWLLRAAAGFTGRANSALPVGDPGLPLSETVAAVTDWYRRRGLPPMIAVPGVLLAGSPPNSLETFLAERAWVSRPGPAFVMTADVADIRLPAVDTDFRLDPEPDAGWLALYRYRGQELPPIARTMLMSAPWQAFGSIRRDGRQVAVGRISIGAGWAMITAVEVDPSSRRQGRRPRPPPHPAPGRGDQRSRRRPLYQVRLQALPPLPLPHRPGVARQIRLTSRRIARAITTRMTTPAIRRPPTRRARTFFLGSCHVCPRIRLPSELREEYVPYAIASDARARHAHRGALARPTFSLPL
jgi:hypothetical protein